MPRRIQSLNIFSGQAVSAMQLPVGIATPFSGDSTQVPDGFMIADGRAISRATYRALSYLYSLAAYPFGNGDGINTFNVPDMRGRTIIGKDNMAGTAANRVTTAGCGINGTVTGAAGGTQNYTLAIGELPAHSHGGTGNNNQSLNHYHGGIAQGGGGGWVDNDDGQANGYFAGGGSTAGWSNDGHTHSIPNYGGSGGNALPHSNMPPTQLTYWIIKV